MANGSGRTASVPVASSARSTAVAQSPCAKAWALSSSAPAERGCALVRRPGADSQARREDGPNPELAEHLQVERVRVFHLVFALALLVPQERVGTRARAAHRCDLEADQGGAPVVDAPVVGRGRQPLAEIGRLHLVLGNEALELALDRLRRSDDETECDDREHCAGGGAHEDPPPGKAHQAGQTPVEHEAERAERERERAERAREHHERHLPALRAAASRSGPAVTRSAP